MHVKRLLTFLLGLSFVFQLAAPFSNSTECGRAAQYGSGCPTASPSIGAGGVDLRGSSSGGGGAGGGRSGGGGGGTVEVKGPPTVEDYLAERNRREEFTVTGPAGTPVVTLADIASFRPTVGADRMEPNGWMVVGLHTNFYSDATRHDVAGTLLGYPASVRFTPRAWHWTYGDGQSLSSARPGASWAAQQLAEFDPTSTSHVYAAAGTYTIDLSVEFSAEYRFGGPDWVPIAGTVTVPANRIVATAGDAKTVLVGRDCAANPRGAGC